VSGEDKAYLAHLISARTGLDQAAADKSASISNMTDSRSPPKQCGFLINQRSCNIELIAILIERSLLYLELGRLLE
jgi:hypothetical protein